MLMTIDEISTDNWIYWALTTYAYKGVIHLYTLWARGSIVVEPLCYKPDGQGLENQ
jgi:hypothetical protein